MIQLKPLFHSEASQVAVRLLLLTVGITVLGAMLWILWLVRMYRREQFRRQNNCCLQCGYDLRYATHRCPECGELITHADQL